MEDRQSGRVLLTVDAFWLAAGSRHVTSGVARAPPYYVFRETLIKKEIWHLADWQPQDLVADRSWSADYFKPGDRAARRRYFAQA